MSHKMLRPFIVKVSVLGYFTIPLIYIYIYIYIYNDGTCKCTHNLMIHYVTLRTDS